MPRKLMLIPAGPDVGLTTIALGLVRAIDNLGVNVGFFKPISQIKDNEEHSIKVMHISSGIKLPEPISVNQTKTMLSQGNKDELLEEIVAKFEELANKVDVIVIEGLVANKDQPFAPRLNAEIAKALDAKIILVSSLLHDDIKSMEDSIEITANIYGGLDATNIMGCIINRVGFPHVSNEEFIPSFSYPDNHQKAKTIIQEIVKRGLTKKKTLKLIAAVPWNRQLMLPRVKDIANFYNAKIINKGNMDNQRVYDVRLCARSLDRMFHILQPGTLIITAGDRTDIILAVSMAYLSGIKLAGLLLTGGYPLKKDIKALCQEAFKQGLTVMSVKRNSFFAAASLIDFNIKVPEDDYTRIERIQEYTASFIDMQWLQTFVRAEFQRRLSPPAFRYQLIKKARSAKKAIVLPEGTEPRTLTAANICQQREIANCILLGDPEEIYKQTENSGFTLNEKIKIINPNDVRENYVKPLVELRKHKNLTEIVAREQLQDNVVLGTMMLQLDEVDGLVSGAEHTTANTIRPALQLIKTPTDVKLVSSIFFMCLPEQVLVYGDCAVNPNPNAEELADIAIQSADSASAFGIEPRVAMISYSTGTSGSGTDVEKVRSATEIVKQLRPDILVDGPLQYDTASIQSVAKKKAPTSKVAGNATVFIFPDLNTGNTTYKAVQRSANVVCIGPMLQGLNKPVNDLSRGALVEDIVYTIAITAIQASIKEN